MLINHISISRKTTWETCQKSYYYKYDQNLLPEGPEPFHFIFGKLVHFIAEQHTKNQGKINLTEIKNEVLEGNLQIEGKKAPKIDNETSARLTKHINNYLRLANDLGYNGYTEWEFNYDLDAPNKRFVKGFIDRLIVTKDKAIIVDYKTTKPGKWRKDSNNITQDMQLACYCWVVMKEFNLPADKIFASLYYLEDAKLVPVRFSEKTLLSIPEVLLKVYKDIENTQGDNAKGTVGSHCYWCAYKNICPFYRS